jgi:hypothetical protein
LSSPSNLYAEKIFAEQPIALWTLDEKCDYISYVSENNRKFYDYTNQWLYTGITPTTGENGTVVEFPSYSESVIEDFIFKDSAITRITPPDATPGSTSFFTVESRFNFDVLENNFAVGFYVYSDTDIENITITASSTTSSYTQSKSTGFIFKQKQIHASTTFTATEILEDVKITIRVDYNYSPISHKMYFNGFSAGTFSEEFSSTSLGSTSINLPSEIPISLNKGVEAFAYASEEDQGYYLVENNRLLARNSSIPLVFGASNSTVIQKSNDSNPSLIIPGKGFLNERGISSTLTFEAWLRINANNSNERIIGPISSEDGVYVDGPFLTLRVGNNVGSHFMGEWFRPILLNVCINNTSASMIVNGEQVVSFNLTESRPQYASPKNSFGEDQDWIGFYAYENIPEIEIDCVAIYPYEVTTLLAKRRFVYGQGVRYPEEVNIAYSGESFFVDYSFSNYSKNYNFPTNASWEQGTSDNVSFNTSEIFSPNYALPNLISSDPSLNINSLVAALDVFDNDISLNANSAWQASSSFFSFPSMNVLQSPVFGFFGVFNKPVSDNSTNQQVLVKITNTRDPGYFSIVLEGTTVKYIYKPSSGEEVELDYNEDDENYIVTKGVDFAVGINLQSISQEYPFLQSFFANRSVLSIFVMGDYSGTDLTFATEFTGIMRRFGLMTFKNLQEFLPLFEKGILKGTSSSITNASYEFLLTKIANVSKLEIKTKSYWDAHVPLTSLSKTFTKSNGTKENYLDFVQINLDYPQTRLSSNSEIESRYDLVKTYVTFQYLKDGANKPLSDFTELSYVPKDKVLVSPGSNSENWKTTKYQVVDGSIVYLPPITEPDTVYDIAICVHVEMINPSSITKTLRNRYIGLSSQSLSDNSSSAIEPIDGIGSRFGKYIYPYTANVAGGFPNNISYKSKNPFKIFKDVASHLYLTSNSGISMVGDFDEDLDRGLFFRLNRNVADGVNISSLQMSVLWNEKLFPETDQEMFEVVSSTGIFKFYIKSITADRRRAQITAKLFSNNVETETSAVSFFWNGNRVSKPTMTINEWGMLGISFVPFLSFSSSVGYLKITSPCIFNNISTYQLDPTIQAQQIVFKPWSDILEDPNDEDSTQEKWEDLLTITWQDALYKTSDVNPSIDPSEIYRVYIGTNKIISDSTEVSGSIKLGSYEYRAYQNVIWTPFAASTL